MRNIAIAFLLCLFIALCSQCVYISRSSIQSYSTYLLPLRLKNLTIFQTALMQAHVDAFCEEIDFYLINAEQDITPIYPDVSEDTDTSDSSDNNLELEESFDAVPEESSSIVSEESESEESSIITEAPSFSGTVLFTSSFEFTIPEDWTYKVALVESDTVSTYHLYYMNGLTEEALKYGYYQSIFDINLFTSEADMDKVRNRKDRFDIIGEKDGITYVLTQRTDSALEFYDATVHEDIKSMMSGVDFPQIIASFTFY